jgi:hypothetical protein
MALWPALVLLVGLQATAAADDSAFSPKVALYERTEHIQVGRGTENGPALLQPEADFFLQLTAAHGPDGEDQDNLAKWECRCAHRSCGLAQPQRLP